jgi:hypothetical protein
VLHKGVPQILLHFYIQEFHYFKEDLEAYLLFVDDIFVSDLRYGRRQSLSLHSEPLS